MLKLLDLSGKIDPPTVELCEALDAVANAIGVPFCLVGATARSIIMETGFRIRSARATKDVDIALQVSGWDEFDRLKQALLDSGRFSDARETQRLIFRNELPVDIIPFGGISDPDGNISWPPDHDFIMSTAGFEEAFQAAQLVRVRAHPTLDIRVASLAGLAILKIIV
jgi:predicted nucleotidyltransferase